MTGALQHSGSPVYRERNDVVALLVRRVEKRAVRIQREEPGPLSAGWLADKQPQPPAVGDRENCYAVVPAIRHIDEPPIRCDPDFFRP